jgi:ubiquinone/menaquinone biosynthesis C-methylase UbiE
MVKSHHLRRASLCIAILIVASVWLAAQSVHPATGRHIAPVMGAGGAAWLDRPQRQTEENTALAIDELHLKPGMMVADIGAGTGYYSLRMAKLVAPDGKIFAVDIQPAMLDHLRSNARAANVTNVETVLGSDSNPNLPESSLDLVIMVDVYHELSQPQLILRHIRAALKPNGRLVLLEYRKEDRSIPIRPEHKMSLQDVKAEVQPEGYVFENSIENLPWQHMIFFKPARVN